MLFVRYNNFDNSLYSTSRNATVFNFNAEHLDSDTYNQSIYYNDPNERRQFLMNTTGTEHNNQQT